MENKNTSHKSNQDTTLRHREEIIGASEIQNAGIISRQDRYI